MTSASSRPPPSGPAARAVAPTVELPSTGVGIGTLFADCYAIEVLLGQGGMGAVYRARDVELDEPIALKVLRGELASEPGALDRFRREVKLARRVTHANVARTYDLGRHVSSTGEVRFLTMELIDGEALSRRVGNGRRLAIPDALRVAADVARGLAAAHAVGVVHRDLKPDNVMLAATRAVITDFGIARSSDAAGQRSATLGVAIGTPAYMAPEQVEGREIDGRADVFAFGVLLYEALTGALPFSGDSFFAVASARLTGPTPDPRTIDPSISEPIAALVRETLARRREDRPGAQQLLQRVEALRGAGRDAMEAGPRTAMLESLVSPSSLSRIVTPTGPRTLAIAPLSGSDATASGVGGALSSALSDGLSRLRGMRVLSPGSVRSAMGPFTEDGVLDAAALGRAMQADWVVEGSVRVAGDRVRARVRMVDSQTGVQPWADRFEASMGDLFELEDKLVDAVAAAVRGRVADGEGKRGPSDAAAREAYERARSSYFRFSQPAVRDSIRTLEEALAVHTDDPWLLSALGASRTRLWLLGGAVERDSIVSAEEVALRALAIDPTIGETFATIGIFRLQNGETRAAVHAFQEALQRSPLLAEAHEYLGRLLVESGHVEAGVRRLALASRLDRRSINGYWERARVLALQGDFLAAMSMIGEGEAASGSPVAGVFNRVRLAIWFAKEGRAIAQQLVELMEGTFEDAAGLRGQALPVAKAIAEGRSLKGILNVFDILANASIAAPRQRAFFFQLAAELYAAGEDDDKALEAVTRAAELPLIDLLWLDSCPVLARIRDDASFVQARAKVAARVADVWT